MAFAIYNSVVVLMSADDGDEMKSNRWAVSGKRTVGPVMGPGGALLLLLWAFGEGGGVRDAHTRWSMWYSSCCGRHRPCIVSRGGPTYCITQNANGGGGRGRLIGTRTLLVVNNQVVITALLLVGKSKWNVWSSNAYTFIPRQAFIWNPNKYKCNTKPLN